MLVALVRPTRSRHPACRPAKARHWPYTGGLWGAACRNLINTSLHAKPDHAVSLAFWWRWCAPHAKLASSLQACPGTPLALACLLMPAGRGQYAASGLTRAPTLNPTMRFRSPLTRPCGFARLLVAFARPPREAGIQPAGLPRPAPVPILVACWGQHAAIGLTRASTLNPIMRFHLSVDSVGAPHTRSGHPA